jgi:hypothetical protein
LDNAQQRQALLAEQMNRQSPDLTQNSTRLISSVEMTPPDEEGMDQDFLAYPAKSCGGGDSFGGKPCQLSTSSSVFMSPKVSDEDW